MRINPEQLITFSVVAEYGSVSKAAELLNLSQPSISGHLKGLQEQAGQPLYRRRARGIELTPAGEQLLPYAHAVARNVQHVEEQIYELRHRPVAPVKLGFSYTLSPHIAPLTIRARDAGLRLMPSAETSANLLTQVLSSELDAALVVSPIQVPDGKLEAHIIGGDELRLIVPPQHRLAQQGYVHLSTLAGEAILWAGTGSAVRQQAERLLEEASLSPQEALDLGSLDAVRIGVLEGHGVAILPGDFVRCEVQAGYLCSLGIEATHTTITHLLVTPPSRVLSPEVRLLADLISHRTAKDKPFNSSNPQPSSSSDA